MGDTLAVDRIGNDVRFEWAVPAADATHGAATLYRVYASSSPSEGFAVDGMSIEPWHVDADGALEAATVYYVVVAENGGGTSGEEPAP